MSPLLIGCTQQTTQQYEASALVTYTWQVEYISDVEKRHPRIERFATTSLLNQNGERPDDAVTGPDDQGLWWPALPPRPTVDEMEALQKPGETIETPRLDKSVEYTFTYNLDGQTQTLPTNYSVYRQVVKSYPSQTPLEVTLGVNDASVQQVTPLAE